MDAQHQRWRTQHRGPQWALRADRLEALDEGARNRQARYERDAAADNAPSTRFTQLDTRSAKLGPHITDDVRNERQRHKAWRKHRDITQAAASANDQRWKNLEVSDEPPSPSRLVTVGRYGAKQARVPGLSPVPIWAEKHYERRKTKDGRETYRLVDTTKGPSGWQPSAKCLPRTKREGPRRPGRCSW